MDPAGRRLVGRRDNVSDIEIFISGRGFGDAQSTRRKAADVLLDGRPLELIDRGWHHDFVRTKPPSFERAEREGYAVPGTAELVIHDTDGRPSKPYPAVLARSRQELGGSRSSR